MELEVLQENLSKALSNVSRVVSSKTSLPILNNVLLRTDGKSLLIAGTNLEIASTQYVGAKTIQPGSITVPAKIATDYIQNLPKKTVVLKVTKNTLHITCDTYKSTINGLSDEEFPELPNIEESTAVIYTIATNIFKEAIQQTIIAASSDATRPVLTGVYWHVYDGWLYLAATDGYRLAEKKLMKVSTDIAAIVPMNALQEVLRSITDETEEVEVLFDDIQVRFRFGDNEITSRLIDGNFPDYRQLIPSESENSFTIEKNDLSRVVKIAALFARESGGAVTFTLDNEDSVLSVHSITSEVGENSSSIKVGDVKGLGVITLNARYVLEMLGVISTETLRVGFSGSIAPSVFESSKKDANYKHIIMPIKS